MLLQRNKKKINKTRVHFSNVHVVYVSMTINPTCIFTCNMRPRKKKGIYTCTLNLRKGFPIYGDTVLLYIHVHVHVHVHDIVQCRYLLDYTFVLHVHVH